MSNTRARLHMHNHREPEGRAYIVGEPAALRQLGEALIKASRSALGFENVDMYTSDGHRYQLFVTCNVSESEWQELPVPYDRKHNPENLEIVKTYDEIRAG
jgi:hypothetical protein